MRRLTPSTRRCEVGREIFEKIGCDVFLDDEDPIHGYICFDHLEDTNVVEIEINLKDGRTIFVEVDSLRFTFAAGRVIVEEVIRRARACQR